MDRRGYWQTLALGHAALLDYEMHFLERFLLSVHDNGDNVFAGIVLPRCEVLEAMLAFKRMRFSAGKQVLFDLENLLRIACRWLLQNTRHIRFSVFAELSLCEKWRTENSGLFQAGSPGIAA